MRNEDARERNLAWIRSARAELTWDNAARKLLDVYAATCEAPAGLASARERRQGIMQGQLSDDAMRLIGPSGVLPSDVERPLLALATHPRIGDPVFRAIKAGYRASYAFRRSRQREGERERVDR
jgi:hypothetical protein